MARVDTVIDYRLVGFQETVVPDDILPSYSTDPIEAASHLFAIERTRVAVATKVKLVAATALLGVRAQERDSSMCSTAMLGSVAKPDDFEIGVTVDGRQTFGYRSADAWIYHKRGHGNGVLVPAHETTMTGGITKTAKEWANIGIEPNGVLALAGVDIKLRLDATMAEDSPVGLVSAVTTNSELICLTERYNPDQSTVGVMLRFSGFSHEQAHYPDMWLGEPESVEALNAMATALAPVDPDIESGMDTVLRHFEWGKYGIYS